MKSTFAWQKPSGALWLAVGLTCFIPPGPSALAHGLTKGQITVELRGEKATVVLTPPAATFSQADTNNDGLLSKDEIHAQRAAILKEVEGDVALIDQSGLSAKRAFADVLVGRDHHAGTEGSFVKIITKYVWDDAPTALTLRYALFSDNKPEPMEATVVVSPALTPSQAAQGEPPRMATATLTPQQSTLHVRLDTAP